MPTYVLSKVVRTGADQKVGNLADQDVSGPGAPTALDTLAAEDKLLAVDSSDSNKIKTIVRTAFMTWLNALVMPTWAKVTGRPEAFPPSSHTHAASSLGTTPSGETAAEDKLVLYKDGVFRRPFDPTEFSNSAASNQGGNTQVRTVGVAITTDSLPNVDYTFVKPTGSLVSFLVPISGGGWRRAFAETGADTDSGTYVPQSGDVRGIVVVLSQLADTEITLTPVAA